MLVCKAFDIQYNRVRQSMNKPRPSYSVLKNYILQLGIANIDLLGEVSKKFYHTLTYFNVLFEHLYKG